MSAFEKYSLLLADLCTLAVDRTVEADVKAAAHAPFVGDVGLPHQTGRTGRPAVL
jgi:hypothetical protein